MQRKTDTIDLNNPIDDVDCWERYPKHRWMYDLTRLLDAQSIKWSLYFTDDMTDRELIYDMYSAKAIIRQYSVIYTKKAREPHTLTEVYIVKGEIKLMRHIDAKTRAEVSGLIGELELRINAFVTLYFQKFTGVVGIETYVNEIFRIQLRPYVELSKETNQEVIKLVKRIYKRSDTTVGLSDQVFHESLAS